MLTHPISVYINWASYDELSDNVELDEALAMRQLEELLRLRSLGIRFDYYLMDAFWFALDGGYRTWRKPHWPDGPDRWLNRCLETGVKPALWVASNVTVRNKLNCHPNWRDSFDETTNAMCCFYGGFLQHFIETLELWYARGVRMYKFDFANFAAAPPHLRETMLPSEIRAANISAFQGALKAFRRSHPEAMLIAYNGFEEIHSQSRTDQPLRKSIDHRWLDTFDSIYCGDPRPSDVPAMNFWRSKDVYSDHMVWFYQQNNLPLERIDNSGFMIGTTGTCYHRGTAAWKGMLILGLARGGWVNTYYGNLELLTAEDGAWFAEIQQRFLRLQKHSHTVSFGGVPGEGEIYGFASLEDGAGGFISVVNPSQKIASIEIPMHGELIFTDAGFEPILDGTKLTLGSEQMALIGVGAAYTNILPGKQDDVIIPQSIAPLDAHFTAEGDKAIITLFDAIPESGNLRIIMRQSTPRGDAKRSTGGSPPDGTPLGQIFSIEVFQNDQPIPVVIQYDKAIWSGLSWAVGEVDCSLLKRDSAISIRLSTTERETVTLSGEIYHVVYR